VLQAQETQEDVPDRPHMCRHAHGGHAFDVGTVSTVHGVLQEIRRIDCPGCGHTGIHLSLTVDDAPLIVHVGPDWFVDKSGVDLSEGDELSVEGSVVEMDGENVVIAATITRGDSVLKLRGPDGFPAWGGWRRTSGGS
jgi:hypothetical protein